jgi:hypothetical protein
MHGLLAFGLEQVVQSTIGANPGLKFNLLFYSLCISARLSISKLQRRKLAPTGFDKISREIFPNL